MEPKAKQTDGNINVATFQLAPGYGKFAAFCPEPEVDYYKEKYNPITIDASKLVLVRGQFRHMVGCEPDETHQLV